MTSTLTKNKEEECDWKQELRSSITSYEKLCHEFKLSFPKTSYPIFIPPHVIKRIHELGVNSAYAKTYLPQEEETLSSGLIDPIGDLSNSPFNGVIHRYENRVLFMPTTFCPVLCRHCFRKNLLNEQSDLLQGRTQELIQYLQKNPQVEEVILTGGDPLILTNEKILTLLKKIKSQTKIKFIRFHTKTPLVIPNRVNSGLIELLIYAVKEFDMVHMALHINHETELNEAVKKSIQKLTSISGLRLLSQSVLLKNINDDSQTLKNLFLRILQLGITPYYLHHPDKVKGGAGFYVELEKGRSIYLKLRSILPGWAIPQYIIDAPGGHGKLPAFNPESLAFSGKLLSRQGELIDI